jgi:hypothetical protein
VACKMPRGKSGVATGFVKPHKVLRPLSDLCLLAESIQETAAVNVERLTVISHV